MRLSAIKVVVQVGNFVEAVTGPDCDDAEYARRRAACEGCEHIVRKDAAAYCGACICPQADVAKLSERLARVSSELTNKLRRDNYKCPKNNW